MPNETYSGCSVTIGLSVVLGQVGSPSIFKLGSAGFNPLSTKASLLALKSSEHHLVTPLLPSQYRSPTVSNQPPNIAVERDRRQAVLAGTLRGFAAPAALHLER